MESLGRVTGILGFLLAASFSLIDGVSDILLAIQHYKCTDQDEWKEATSPVTQPKPPSCPILQNNSHGYILI